MTQNVREQKQNEAVEVSMKYHRCTLAMSMRFGKTYTALKRLKKEYDKDNTIRILIVAPKVKIFDEWKDNAIKFGLEELLYNIDFSTYLSLTKKSKEYDFIVLDEIHNIKPHHLSFVLSCNCKVLGLTGTPPKPYSDKGKMIKQYIPIVFEYLTDDAVEDGILNDYRIIVHLLPLNTEKTLKVKMKNGQTFHTSEYDSYKYWTSRVESSLSQKEKSIISINRMRAMLNFETKIQYAKKLINEIDEKVIVFAGSKEHANTLSPYRYYSGNPLNKENLEKFKKGEIKVLSCIEQISEGITIKDLSQAIITHFYSGNSAKGFQKFGRILSLSPDEVATCHVLCYKGTVDEMWVGSALNRLDPTKIKVIDTTKKQEA